MAKKRARTMMYIVGHCGCNHTPRRNETMNEWLNLEVDDVGEGVGKDQDGQPGRFAMARLK